MNLCYYKYLEKNIQQTVFNKLQEQMLPLEKSEKHDWSHPDHWTQDSEHSLNYHSCFISEQMKIKSETSESIHSTIYKFLKISNTNIVVTKQHQGGVIEKTKSNHLSHIFNTSCFVRCFFRTVRKYVSN